MRFCGFLRNDISNVHKVFFRRLLLLKTLRKSSNVLKVFSVTERNFSLYWEEIFLYFSSCIWSSLRVSKTTIKETVPSWDVQGMQTLGFLQASVTLFFFFNCSGFCHTLKWISHGFTCVPHPDPPSHLPLHPIPLGLPSAPGPSACLMHPTWAGDLFHPR